MSINLDAILKESMRKSCIKAALLAKQTNTAFIIEMDNKIVRLKGDEIDQFLNNLPNE